MFDTRNDDSTRYGRARDELRALLRPDEYAAAQRSTVNAHYTDPAYVAAIWNAVRSLGFDGGTVLEPGCGIGTFFDGAPSGAKVVGVELEPITAAIARALHPQVDVRNESFADTSLAERTVDLVVGNVPFGDFSLLDARHNPKRHRIHNHFIVKSLHLLRPGGLLVAVTSRYTLDSTQAAAREDMAALADFVGAVRLPTAAHREHAGTDVVTDIVLLRRRPEGQPAAAMRFLETVEFGAGLHINAYFADNPNHVLGELFCDQGERGREELGVRASHDVAGDLSRALERVVQGAIQCGLGFQRHNVERDGVQAETAVRQRERGEYTLTALSDGTFTERRGGVDVKYRPPSTQAAELRLLLELRDTLTSLLDLEAATEGATVEVTRLRDVLDTTYDRYVNTYGPLNRFVARRTGRTDESGEPILARIRPPQGGFRQDPLSSAVYALERFHEETQRADKASIFKERVLQRQPLKVQVETPAEAIQVALDRSGNVDLVQIAELLRLPSEDAARAALGDLVFVDPTTKEFVTRAEYLSGNVREKLEAAKDAARQEAQYEGNVAALQEALPIDIDPADIRVNFGAAWIGPEYIQEFLRTLLNDRTITVERGHGAMWSIDGNGGTLEAADTWGTPHYDALALVQALCEQKPIRVYDRDGALHQTHTTAAIEKATALEAAYRSWIWQDTRRTEALVTKYNAMFNSYVRRAYDASEMTLPGLALSFHPHAHQLEGVAHCLAEPRVGLFHDVGLGKTATMVMATMKAKELDPTRKVGVVVPNHMLEQFSREWLQMYPQARVLPIGTDDLSSPERRKMFIGKCSLSNWDAVILTMAAFEKIPTGDTQKLYMEEQLEALEAELELHRDRRSDMTVKRLEKMKIRLEEKYKELLKTPKDDGLTFERTGINALVVDEIHLFKNLMTPSAVPGIAIAGSNRATDLHLKLWLLEREQHGRRRRGLLVGATATPLSNNIIENYVILKYFAPQALKRVGITVADQFVATFTDKRTKVEISPTGEMRMKERIADYVNRLELRGLWAPFANLRRADQTSLNLPKLRERADGRRAPEVVVVQPTAALRTFMDELAERVDAIRARRVDPKQDNHLRLSSEGRRVAQDFRLLDPPAAVGIQKVDVASERIAAIYDETKASVYLGDDGEEHPRLGALQIVFADLGTPKQDGAWSLYEQLKTQLAELGVPAEKVRFVHEAKNDKQKAELFRACREGEVAVLVGSTEKMGVGTNIQARAIALHHIDVPYRPSDVTQREGRILRQGNQNSEVQVYRYVTEGSFDAYVWQLVTGKNEHQQGFLNWDSNERTVSAGAMDEVQLSLQEIKALATGNPLLMEHAECLAEVKRLRALEEAHVNSQRYRESRRSSATWKVTNAEQCIERMSAALAQLPSGELAVGEAFPVEVEGKQHHEQAPANRALVHAVGLLRNRYIVRWKTEGRANEALFELNTEIGKLGPFGIVVASTKVAQDALVIRLVGAPIEELELSSREELARLNDGSMQLVQRLLNQVRKLPARLQATRLELTIAKNELVRVADDAGHTDFPHAAELLTRRLRLEELERELAAGATQAPELQGPRDFRYMPTQERDAFITAAIAEYEEKRGELFERSHRAAARWLALAQRRFAAAVAAVGADGKSAVLREQLVRANRSLIAARSAAADARGELTQRVQDKMRRCHQPLAQLLEEIRAWQQGGEAREPATPGNGAAPDPVERWETALAAAEEIIKTRATLICRRIAARSEGLHAKLRSHRATRPVKLFNAEAFKAWVRRDDQIQTRLKQLAAAATRVAAFMKDEADGLHSPRRTLAVQRVQRRLPELVRELSAHRIAAARELGVAKQEHRACRTR